MLRLNTSQFYHFLILVKIPILWLVYYLFIHRSTPITNNEIDAFNLNKWHLKLATTLFEYHTMVICVLFWWLLYWYKKPYYERYILNIPTHNKNDNVKRGLCKAHFYGWNTSFPLIDTWKSVFSLLCIYGCSHISSMFGRTYHTSSL